jgi:hypothetical protein
MAGDERFPHLRLLTPKAFDRRRVVRRPPGPPPRVPATHGARLRDEIAAVRARLDEHAARLPGLTTDVPYLRVSFAPGHNVPDVDLRRLGLEPVFRRGGGVVAAYAPEREATRLRGQVNAYAAERKALAALAKIEHLGPWTRIDRWRGDQQILQGDETYTLDLVLLPTAAGPRNRAAIDAIAGFLQVAGGKVVDQVDAPTFSALRIRGRGQALETLLEYRDDVAYVDLPPKASVLVPAMLHTDVDQLPAISEPPPTAPAVCLVDSGVVEGHPLLAAAMMADRSRAYPGSLGPPVPTPPVTRAGHGTNVAGVALYGDVAACLSKRDFVASLWLINARILDDNGELEPDRMPLVRRIIEDHRDRCRVFNLSLGLSPCDGAPSMYAAELDALAREHDVLFVVSAGNENTAQRHNRGEALVYPDYLIELPVLAPAEALNALTVGAISRDSDPYPHALPTVAPKRAPSPFTRSGGLPGVVKPELVEEGGNYAINVRQWVSNDPGVGVPTTSHRPGKLFDHTLGTSVAAPRVARMAALLLDRYPSASANLVRALLVHSAQPPDGVKDWSRDLVMATCGFGVPDLDRAMYSRPGHMTLYFEGEIAVDQVLIFDVPVPAAMMRARGRKHITVTLAYDPAVSLVDRERPRGVVLTWNLARGDVPIGRVHDAIVAASADAPRQPTPAAKVFMTGSLSKTRQSGGTVQKNVFTWVRGDHGETYRLAVVATAPRPGPPGATQRFAVVVGLAVEDATIDLHAELRARLAAGRVRVRVGTE